MTLLKLFLKLTAQARRSLLPRFNEKRPTSLSFKFGKSFGKCHCRWDRLYIVEFLEFSQGVSNVFVLTCKGGLVCWLLTNPHDFSQKSFLYPNPIFVAQILVMFWRILAAILKQLSKSKMVESGYLVGCVLEPF
jgi:hypothetical protein